MLSVRRKPQWYMLIIILAAALLRFVALPSLPLGFHYDEAANLTLTHQIAAGDYRPIFIRAYTGKEVLFFYFAVPWVRITGMPWGLRLSAAMLGVLTVAATYPAVRALLRVGRVLRTARGGQVIGGFKRYGHWVALLSSAWVAVSFPHLVLSRYGFRAISQPLLQALTIATLWRGLRSCSRRSNVTSGMPVLSRRGDWIRRKSYYWNNLWLLAAGSLLGLTAYTYLAARLFPIPLALALGFLLLNTPRGLLKQRLLQFAVVLAVALLVFSPLGIYFLGHPDAFATRIRQVASSTWRDAARGIGLCLRALAWPNAGDPYVRFNEPGRPLCDPLSAILGLIGGVGLLWQPLRTPLNRAGRFFLFALSFVMLLPSALATSEITPSNLRLVGLYPFLAVFPVQGIIVMIQGILRLRLPLSEGEIQAWHSAALMALLIGGGISTGWAYSQWAHSTDLFYAADGEMVLAARALDTLDLTNATPYVASLHYRHPTVAALAQNYAQAKWLTGGATLVLPQEGEALYLWPRSLSPPAPWPDKIVERWEATSAAATFSDPDGNPALIARRLSVDDIKALRHAYAKPEAAVSEGNQADFSHATDFSHVVLAHDAGALLPCSGGSSCPVLLVWEAHTPYPALQPVVRLVHPLTGEWARTTAFHYPPEQWASGDLVLDQFTLVPPLSAPPVSGYEIAVGFFNPDDGSVLSRLDEKEQFAGLEVRYAMGELLPQRHLQASRPSPPDGVHPCCDLGSGCWDEPLTVDGIRLLGADVTLGDFPPGGKLPLTLCWQAGDRSLPSDGDAQSSSDSPEDGMDFPEGDVEIFLDRSRLPDTPDTRLYKGAPVQGLYPFSQWSEGEIVEDRYTLRLPRNQPPGVYELRLEVVDTPLYNFGTLRVISLTRKFIDTFALPDTAHALTADFGGRVRLLGYRLGAVHPGRSLKMDLYWQTLQEMDEDYTVFVHLLDPGTGQLLAQVDEWPQGTQALQQQPPLLESVYPTSLWMQDEVVHDTHHLSVPADLPSGPYQVQVGLYVQQTGARLRVNGATGLILSKIDGGRK